MSRDLRQLLEDAAATPADGPDVEAVRRRGRWLRWRRRLGVAAAVLVVVGAALTVPTFLPEQPSAPVIGQRPTQDTPTASTPSETAPAPPTGTDASALVLRTGQWQRVSDEDLGVDGVLEYISGGAVSGDGTIVAVGTSQRPEGIQEGAVWLGRSDGDWVAVEDPALSEGTDVEINAVWGGATTVAVGAAGPQHAATGTGQQVEPDRAGLTAAVWLSGDGGRGGWMRTASERIDGAAAAEMADVAGDSRRLLAVGVSEEQGSSPRPVVWIGEYGSNRWTPLQTNLPAGAETTFGPLTSDGQRFVLAVDEPVTHEEGASELATTDRDAKLWWSDDGQRWQPVKDPGGALTGPGDQTVADLLVVDGTFLAIGRASSRQMPDGSDVAWASTDGITWQLAARNLDIPSAANDFVARDDALVALSVVTRYETESLTEADPAVWTTPFRLVRTSAG